MDRIELTLLRGALRSAQTIVLHGFVSSEADTLASLNECHRCESVDLRGAATKDAAALRTEINAQLNRKPTLFLKLPTSLSEAMRLVLRELSAGRLELEPEGRDLAEETRVVAFSEEQDLDADTSILFGLQISGMQVIEAQRQAVQRAEEELRVAQERARESSRKYGLV